MNDKEKKLKDKIEKYEIKTSADDILKSYEKIEKSKNTRPDNPFKRIFIRFGLPLSFASICFIAVASVGAAFQKSRQPINPVISHTLDSKESNLLKNELVALNYNLELETNQNASISSFGITINAADENEEESNKDLTDVEYANVIDKFDIIAPTYLCISNDLGQKIEAKTIEQFSGYTYHDSTYVNKTEYYYEGNKLYDLYFNISKKTEQDEKWKFVGLMIKGEDYYLLDGTKEIDSTSNEYEITTNIYSANFKYTISKEIEDDESEYSFKKYDFTSKKTFTCNVEKEINSQDYEVTIKENGNYEYVVSKVTDNEYIIEYDELIINLKYENDGRIYTSANYETIRK